MRPANKILSRWLESEWLDNYDELEAALAARRDTRAIEVELVRLDAELTRIHRAQQRAARPAHRAPAHQIRRRPHARRRRATRRARAPGNSDASAPGRPHEAIPFEKAIELGKHGAPAGNKNAAKLRQHGGDRKSEGAKADQAANGSLKCGSNSAAYRRARLARDFPKIAAALAVHS